MSEVQTEIAKKRKNQPGDVRNPGTKDYSVILGHLINYKHQLVTEKDEQKIGDFIARIAQKLIELGFEDPAHKLKARLGRRKAGKYQDITLKKKQDAIDTAAKYWQKGYEINEKAKQERKEEKKKRSTEEGKSAS
ncbi:MAG: hypothetical protein MUE85_10160 [Microscillaceae bacterium]|jgi:hypothetical protein|nr:hypothetical protein [Microscillaceae bacterium]